MDRARQDHRGFPRYTVDRRKHSEWTNRWRVRRYWSKRQRGRMEMVQSKTCSQRRRPASTMDAAHPRAAPLRNESSALLTFRATPWPCLNFLPQCKKSIPSRRGARACFHDLHAQVAAQSSSQEKDPAIRCNTSKGRKLKSGVAAEEETIFSTDQDIVEPLRTFNLFSLPSFQNLCWISVGLNNCTSLNLWGQSWLDVLPANGSRARILLNEVMFRCLSLSRLGWISRVTWECEAWEVTSVWCSTVSREWCTNLCTSCLQQVHAFTLLDQYNWLEYLLLAPMIVQSFSACRHEGMED